MCVLVYMQLEEAHTRCIHNEGKIQLVLLIIGACLGISGFLFFVCFLLSVVDPPVITCIRLQIFQGFLAVLVHVHMLQLV